MQNNILWNLKYLCLEVSSSETNGSFFPAYVYFICTKLKVYVKEYKGPHWLHAHVIGGTVCFGSFDSI